MTTQNILGQHHASQWDFFIKLEFPEFVKTFLKPERNVPQNVDFLNIAELVFQADLEALDPRHVLE